MVGCCGGGATVCGRLRQPVLCACVRAQRARASGAHGVGRDAEDKEPRRGEAQAVQAHEDRGQHGRHLGLHGRVWIAWAGHMGWSHASRSCCCAARRSRGAWEAHARGAALLRAARGAPTELFCGSSTGRRARRLGMPGASRGVRTATRHVAHWELPRRSTQRPRPQLRPAYCGGAAAPPLGEPPPPAAAVTVAMTRSTISTTSAAGIRRASHSYRSAS